MQQSRKMPDPHQKVDPNKRVARSTRVLRALKKKKHIERVSENNAKLMREGLPVQMSRRHAKAIKGFPKSYWKDPADNRFNDFKDQVQGWRFSDKQGLDHKKAMAKQNHDLVLAELKKQNEEKEAFEKQQWDWKMELDAEKKKSEASIKKYNDLRRADEHTRKLDEERARADAVRNEYTEHMIMEAQVKGIRDNIQQIKDAIARAKTAEAGTKQVRQLQAELHSEQQKLAKLGPADEIEAHGSDMRALDQEIQASRLAKEETERLRNLEAESNKKVLELQHNLTEEQTARTVAEKRAQQSQEIREGQVNVITRLQDKVRDLEAMVLTNEKTIRADMEQKLTGEASVIREKNKQLTQEANQLKERLRETELRYNAVNAERDRQDRILKSIEEQKRLKQASMRDSITETDNPEMKDAETNYKFRKPYTRKPKYATTETETEPEIDGIPRPEFSAFDQPEPEKYKFGDWRDDVSPMFGVEGSPSRQNQTQGLDWGAGARRPTEIPMGKGSKAEHWQRVGPNFADGAKAYVGETPVEFHYKPSQNLSNSDVDRHDSMVEQRFWELAGREQSPVRRQFGQSRTFEGWNRRPTTLALEEIGEEIGWQRDFGQVMDSDKPYGALTKTEIVDRLAAAGIEEEDADEIPEQSDDEV